MRKSCSFPNCDRPASARELCKGHLQQQYEGKDLHPLKRYKARNGTGWISHHGYQMLYRDGRSQMVHRRVMEEQLGRRLQRDEHVHHINGNRLDNRPENLELWLAGHKPGQRVQDRIQDAVGLLERYAPERLA